MTIDDIFKNLLIFLVALFLFKLKEHLKPIYNRYIDTDSIIYKSVKLILILVFIVLIILKNTNIIGGI